MGHRVFLDGYQGLFNGFEGVAVGSLFKVPKGVERVLWRIVTFFKGCCKEFAPYLITRSLFDNSLPFENSLPFDGLLPFDNLLPNKV